MTEIQKADLVLPNQVGDVYHGKVADTYHLEHERGDLLVMVRTDRISAYDRVLPRLIPYKGQVLNQMSAHFLQATADVAPNWFLDAPDPNVTVGYYAEPIKVEMVVRGAMLGSLWRDYQKGVRKVGDTELPDDMEEFQLFETPLLTPTTKADQGHDEPIEPEQIVEQELATEDEYRAMGRMALDLFARGQSMAYEKGLFFADTKYEFGRLARGELKVIDEVNTPDSSRYYPTLEYIEYLEALTTRRPEPLSKEFAREWLAKRGFTGKSGERLPKQTDSFVNDVSSRYIQLYDTMMDDPFVGEISLYPEARIQANVINCLGKLTLNR